MATIQLLCLEGEDLSTWMDKSAEDDLTTLPLFRVPESGPTYALVAESLGLRVDDLKRSFQINIEISDQMDKEDTARGLSWVIVNPNSALRAPAERFANLTNREIRLTSQPELEIKEARRLDIQSVVVFELASDVNSDLQTALCTVTNSSTTIGLVTGTSPFDVWAWLVRRLAAEHLYFAHYGLAYWSRECAPHSERLNVRLVKITTSYPEMCDALSQPMDVSTIKFHAKESCGQFGAAAFCGRPESLDHYQNHEHEAVPGCFQSGKCLWDLELLPMRDLNSAHVIALSCGSLRLKSRTISLPFNLGFAAWQGRARSYLAPLRFYFSNPLLATYALSLYSTGMKLGEIVLRMNRFLDRLHLDYPCLVLMGDPEDMPRIPDEQDPEALSNVAGIESALRDMSFSPVAVTSKVNPDLSGLRETTSIKQSGLLQQPEMLSPEIAAQLVDLNADDVQFGRVLGRLMKKQVLKWSTSDVNEGFWYSVKYDSSNMRHDIVGRAVCGICGSAAVLHLRQGSKITRSICICEHCGITFDIPANDSMTVDFEIPAVLAIGQQFEMTISIEFPREVSAFAFAVSILHGRKLGWSQFPYVRHGRVPASGRIRQKINCQVPMEFPEFSHHARLFLVTDDGVRFYSRPLLVKGVATQVNAPVSVCLPLPSLPAVTMS